MSIFEEYGAFKPIYSGETSPVTSWSSSRPLNREYKDITKTRLFKYIENSTTKNWKFSDKNSDIFHISAQT